MTNRINHEARNRIERVKNYGPYPRGLEAYTGSEYVSGGGGRKLRSAQRRKADVPAGPPLLDNFVRVFQGLSEASQEVALVMLKRLPGLDIKCQDMAGETRVSMIISVAHGDPELVLTRMVLIAETLSEANSGVTNPLIALLVKHITLQQQAIDLLNKKLAKRG